MSKFGVYVHFPFCRAKCPYCDFYSRPMRDIDEAQWLDAYRKSLKKHAAATSGKTVSSIFFGGGTPSLASPEFIGAIIQTVRELWQTANDAEISLEGNPDSLTADKMRGYRDAGVNRLSVGVQSLNDRELRFLGRLHDARKALDTIQAARGVFDNLSADFIYALPEQSLKDWESALKEILSLDLPHLSLYQLALEENSFFYKKRNVVLPDDDTAAALFEMTTNAAAQRGYTRYEVSNLAKDGFECRHNLLYWTGGEYAGIGAGAGGRYEKDGVFYATKDVPDARLWLQTQQTEIETLTAAERAEELLLTGLRLKKGVSRAAFKSVVGRDLNDFLDLTALERLCAENLMCDDGESIRATRSGVLVLNSLITALSA